MIQELDKKLREYCKSEQISGVLRITVKDEIKYNASFGYANDSKKTVFDEKSMFSFYSMSKPLCAIGLLRLVEQGVVDLDVHPKKYLPEASGFDERVTIRHLLQHVSGLPDMEQTQEFSLRYKGEATYSNLRKHVALISEYPSHFAPNQGGMYANINFIIPALMIENVSGQSYAEYMQEHVFSPLGMCTAVIDNANLQVENRVQGYTLEGNKRTPVERSTAWLLGAGDVVGTIDDAYCLNKAYKHKLLLSKKTWEEIVSPSPINQMGLGNTVFSWHNKRRINHNGGHLGFRTLHIWLPEDDFDVLFLSNSGYGNARSDIAEIIHEAFYGDDEFSQGIEMDKGYI